MVRWGIKKIYESEIKIFLPPNTGIPRLSLDMAWKLEITTEAQLPLMPKHTDFPGITDSPLLKMKNVDASIEVIFPFSVRFSLIF